jgi:hypothetical protein
VLRRPIEPGQHTSIRFTERLAQAGIQPSVGAVGSSYDNALAETINGLYKTELIKPRKPWRSIDDVEMPPPNGCTGSTTAAFTNTAATSRPSNWRRPTTLNNRDQPPAESSNRKVSELTGMLHLKPVDAEQFRAAEHVDPATARTKYGPVKLWVSVFHAALVLLLLLCMWNATVARADDEEQVPGWFAYGLRGGAAIDGTPSTGPEDLYPCSRRT